MAKANEDLGDYDASFAMLAEGNRLRKSALGYDSEDDRDLFEQIRCVSAGLVTSDNDLTEKNRPARPVFVVGMMRSGTSLVEQILASHPDVHGAGELEAMNRLAMPLLESGKRPGPGDVDALRAGYFDSLRELQFRAPVVTDKMPLNFRWIGLIMSAFPEAKIVHVRRDPVATCWSVYKHFFPAEGHGYAWNLADIAAYFDLYSDLVAYWHERFPGAIYDICYETLTEQQEAETRKLLDYCELKWDPACLAFDRTERTVATSSVAQVRQRMYQGSSRAWRRYEAALRNDKAGQEFLRRLT